MARRSSMALYPSAAPSKGIVRMLVGHPAEPTKLAQAIATLNPDEVVVKLGAHGALAFHMGEAGAEVHWRDAERVTVVDTVGAGDAFVAGYLAERIAGEPVEVRLTTAVRTGAAVCMHSGDWEGAATRAELADLFDGGSSDPVRR
jgi:2-dehydro-3-deoxygluconokinase